MEKEVMIKAEDVVLEGLLEEVEGEKAVAIAHPHPLYGGNMHNNVVTAIRLAFLEKGFSTLRFNFRGVGRSQGTFGEGIEEQRDVEASVEFLRDMGKQVLYLAGYSFGASVAMMAAKSLGHLHGLVLVSLPLGVWNLQAPGPLPAKTLFLTGEYDEVAPLQKLTDFRDRWCKGGTVEIIKGADHFFWGNEKEIYRALKGFLS